MDAAFRSYTLNQNGEQEVIQGAEEEDGLICLMERGGDTGMISS